MAAIDRGLRGRGCAAADAVAVSRGSLRGAVAARERPEHVARVSGRRIAGIRSWICATSSFGGTVRIAIVSTRSSSGRSRHRPCCHLPALLPCCSGRCSLLARSTCERLMVGRHSPRPGVTSARNLRRHAAIPEFGRNTHASVPVPVSILASNADASDRADGAGWACVRRSPLRFTAKGSQPARTPLTVSMGALKRRAPEFWHRTVPRAPAPRARLSGRHSPPTGRVRRRGDLAGALPLKSERHDVTTGFAAVPSAVGARFGP